MSIDLRDGDTMTCAYLARVALDAFYDKHGLPSANSKPRFSRLDKISFEFKGEYYMLEAARTH